MTHLKYRQATWLFTWLFMSVPAAALLADSPGRPSDRSAGQGTFERAYYLETHDGNLAEAAALYSQLASQADLPATVRGEASKRSATCGERLAAADLAGLMPPDTLVYAEVTHPGEQLSRILRMLGLVRDPAEAKAGSAAISLGHGMFLPADFTISPALVNELKKFHGLAAGLTRVGPHEQVDGLVVVHPGECDLLRGLLETVTQVLEAGEPIQGFKTYRGPDGRHWITVTSQLVLVAPSREQLTAAVERLRNPKADRLSAQSDFQSWAKQRQNSLAFVHVSGPQLVAQLAPKLQGKEALVARTFLDLDHLQSVVASLGAADDDVQFQVQVNLTTGQHNLLYSLVRTAPLSRRSLDAVPAGAFGVAMIGLNPPTDRSGDNHGAGGGALSLMDIGRELFSNVEELALYALPPADASERQRPEMGLVFSVKDPARSEALWNQLLALPAMLGAPALQAAGDVQIEGIAGHAYELGKGLSLVVVTTPTGQLVVGTRESVTASVRATATKNAIAGDTAFAPLLARLSPQSSKAVLVDIGRTFDWLAANKPNNEKTALMSMLLKNVKLSAITDEAPTQFCVTLQATGLPNVPALLKTVASITAKDKNATQE